MTRIPEGFRKLERPVSIGLAIEAKHTNSRGDKGFVTAHLAVDYAGAAKAGDWIESRVEIQRVGSRLAFANCYLMSAGKPIVRASGIFSRSSE